MTVIQGNVSYYCCCTGGECEVGGGACGDCNDASLHCAYPDLLTGCINDVCIAMPNHDCDDNVNITNKCPGGSAKNITIKDCYPLQAIDCHNPSVCTSQVHPLADLTTGAFLAIGGDLDDGRIPVKMVA